MSFATGIALARAAANALMPITFLDCRNRDLAVVPIREGLGANADQDDTEALDGRERSPVDLSTIWTGRLRAPTLGPRLTYVSEDSMQSYYGVSADQSARSGYDRFDAGAGFRDIGLVSSWTWLFRPSWALTGFTEYSRLLSDAADSPLVDDVGDPNHLVVGAG